MFSLQGLKKNNIVVHVTCHENGAPYAAEQYRYVEHTQRALRKYCIKCGSKEGKV